MSSPIPVRTSPRQARAAHRRFRRSKPECAAVVHHASAFFRCPISSQEGWSGGWELSYPREIQATPVTPPRRSFRSCHDS